MTSIVTDTLINICAKMSSETGMTLAGEVSGYIHTLRILRTYFLLQTLINVETTSFLKLVSVLTTTTISSNSIDAVNVTPTKVSDHLALVYVSASSLQKLTCVYKTCFASALLT